MSKFGRGSSIALIGILQIGLWSCTQSSQPMPQPGAAANAPKPSETATAEQVPTTSPPAPAARQESAAAEKIPYHNPLSAEQAAEGWISLFDGYTLFGWESNNPEVDWKVENGAITAQSGPIGLLNTSVPFADFEFACEFRMAEGGNSGVFIRTLEQPGDPARDCYEVNIADTHPEGFTTGAIVGHAKTEEPIRGSGDWKSLRIRAEANRIAVEVDGRPVLDYVDEAQTRRVGRIGLQKNSGKIEFRNIVLKPLGLADLFNGTDLTGWREVSGSKSEFSVEDSVIRVRNGPGVLETESTFGDFVFQCQAITHGSDPNSGVFFRAMPGTEEAPSNGYEVQIHNGFASGDRTQPTNAGTGAIFRRTTARRVVSSDNEWCTITLVARGNRFAVWVDGYAVTDWADERPPHENPRQGRRDDPGHISLQGHDPTTDLSFRGLRAAELPAP